MATCRRPESSTSAWCRAMRTTSRSGPARPSSTSSWKRSSGTCAQNHGVQQYLRARCRTPRPSRWPLWTLRTLRSQKRSQRQRRKGLPNSHPRVSRGQRRCPAGMRERPGPSRGMALYGLAWPSKGFHSASTWARAKHLHGPHGPHGPHPSTHPPTHPPTHHPWPMHPSTHPIHPQ